MTGWSKGRFVSLSLGFALSLSVLLNGCGRGTELQLHGAADMDWDSYRGKWVFINYWAEWCLPCRKEMPELNEFSRLYPAQAVVLGVNFDNPDSAELNRQLQALGIEFPVLADDPAQLLGYARPSVLPTTLVYDPRGELRSVLVGPQTLASLRMWLAAGQGN